MNLIHSSGASEVDDKTSLLQSPGYPIVVGQWRVGKSVIIDVVGQGGGGRVLFVQGVVFVRNSWRNDALICAQE